MTTAQELDPFTDPNPGEMSGSLPGSTDVYIPGQPGEIDTEMSAEPAMPPENAEEAAEFTAAYAEHYAYIYGMALGWTRNPDTAQDMANQAFMKAWNAWGSFTDEGRGRLPWLQRIARNELINRHRKRMNGEIPTDPQDATEALGDFAVGRTASAEDTYLASGQDGSVAEALKEIPESYRSVIALVDVEGYAYQEAADMIGVPLGTVMSRLHRGRRALRELVLSGEVSLGEDRRQAQQSELN